MKHLPTFESFLNEKSIVDDEQLTVKDYDEFVNPDHVIVTLSDDRKLKIEKKRIQGGQKVYQAILQSLDAYDSNPKAKLFIDNVINGAAKQLS
jgi:DNA-directed RNA polymerase alpha subunit